MKVIGTTKLYIVELTSTDVVNIRAALAKTIASLVDQNSWRDILQDLNDQLGELL